MSGFTREGPAPDEQQIIGVELAYRDPTGREHELEMFACRHTLKRDHYQSNYGEIRVTLHTSDGDITMINRNALRTGTYIAG